MSKLEYQKRLRKLAYLEINLSKKEANLAKDLVKLCSRRTKLEAQISRQSEELQIYQIENQKKDDTNTKLRKFIEEVELRIDQCKQQRDELQQETREQEQKRQHNLAEMDKLRCVKNLSKILIDPRRLPQSIQGAVICEKETSSQLIPFKLDPLKYTPEEVREKLCQIVESAEGVDWSDLVTGFLANEDLTPGICGKEGTKHLACP